MFGFLLIAGFAGIGITRLEERGIVGNPGSAANAMAAIATVTSGDEEEVAEDYSGAPEGATPLSAASRTPGNRIRQILQDQNVPLAAAREIVNPAPPGGGAGAQEVIEPGTSPAITEALAPVPAQAPAFASLAPSGPGTGTPVFAADLAPSNGGGGGGGAGGGGTGGGGTGGDGNGGTANPVSPVPEPSTWLYLILGLFGIGATLRRRPRSSAALTPLVR